MAKQETRVSSPKSIGPKTSKSLPSKPEQFDAIRAAMRSLTQDRAPKRGYGRSLADFKNAETGSRLLPCEQKLLDAFVRDQYYKAETSNTKVAEEFNKYQAKHDSSEILLSHVNFKLAKKRDNQLTEPPHIPNNIAAFVDNAIRQAKADDGKDEDWLPEDDYEHEQFLIEYHRSVRELVSWRAIDTDDPAIQVRAGFLRFLLLGGDEKNRTEEQGVSLKGLHIIGQLDLTGCQLRIPVFFDGCRFDEEIAAIDATCKTLVLNGCFVPGILADRIIVDGALMLRTGSRCEGLISLAGSSVKGDVNLSTATLINNDDVALDLEGADIGGSLQLNNRVYVAGFVNLTDLRVGCNLVCSFGEFRHSRPFGFGATGIEVGGDANFIKTIANSGIKLTSADIHTAI